MGRTGQAAAGGQTLSAPCIRWLPSPEAAPRPWGSWRQGASSLGNAAGTALPCWARPLPGGSGMGVPRQHLLPHPSPAGPGMDRHGAGAPVGQRQHPARHPGGVHVSAHCLLEHCAAREPRPAPGQGEQGLGPGRARGPVLAAHHPPLSQEQVLQGEIAALRAQLSEREDALQSTARRLRSTAQLKDSMEQFIVSQCTWPGGTAKLAWSPPARGGSTAQGPH